MTRLIFIDVDGTLIDERQTVPDSAREALVAAAEAGNRLMLCTGRSIPELYPWLWDLGFTGLVGAAGAYVRVDEDVIADRRIDAETLRRSTQVLRSHGIAWLWQAPEVFYASDSFLEAFNRPDEDEDDAWMPYRRQIAPYLDYGEPRSASKATFVLPRGSDITIDGLDRALGDSLRADPGTVQTGAREIGEILMRDVSKATGLADVAAYLDVPIADTVAIGDSTNDMEVLCAAGVSVAMGNAHDDVKAGADIVTDPIDDDGLAKALTRLGLV